MKNDDWSLKGKKNEKYYIASDVDEKIKKLTEEGLETFKSIDGIIFNRLVFTTFFRMDIIDFSDDIETLRQKLIEDITGCNEKGERVLSDKVEGFYDIDREAQESIIKLINKRFGVE